MNHISASILDSPTTKAERGVQKTPRPIRVLYIMGAGRSGSTILDILLSQHERIVGVGELVRFLRPDWNEEEPCSCGSPSFSCAFWAKVQQHESTDPSIPNPFATWRELAADYERIRHAPTLALARSSASSNRFNAYAQLTTELFETIADEAGCDTVVDSSKSPARALALSMIPEIDLRVIHLIRDPLGTAISFAREWPKDVSGGVQKTLGRVSPLRSAMRWTATNLAAELVHARLGGRRSIRLRYEDLMRDPKGALQRVAELSERDLGPLIQFATGETALTRGHTIAGNRVRMSTHIQLRATPPRIEELTTREKREVDLVTAPLRVRYGYSR